LASARGALSQLRDPEIPTASILELGMLHDLRDENGAIVVELLPTFSGCPAIGVITEEVQRVLAQAGLEPVRVVLRTDLPWSTSMITEAGRRQVAEFDIVPPPRGSLVVEDVVCGNCHQRNVTLISRFGSTPCRATAKCRTCGEPLQLFKPVGVSSGAQNKAVR
jgi:ring-1,2-phenylacetyl-CoA epoxidase subunit PaaD